MRSLIVVFIFSSMISCCFNEGDCLNDIVPCHIRVVDSAGKNLYFGPNKEREISDLTILTVIDTDTSILIPSPIVNPNLSLIDTFLLVEVKQTMTLLLNYQNDQDTLNIVTNSISNKCCPIDGVGIRSVTYNGTSLNISSVLFDLVK